MKTDKLNITELDFRKFKKLIEEYGLSGFSIINNETGEIVQDILNGSTLKNPKLISRNKEGKELVKFQPKELFVKLYKRAIEQLGRELSNRDFSWFIRLCPYVRMQDCTLRNDDGEYLNVKQISELLDVNYDNLKTVFRGYEKNGLIKKVKMPSQKDIYKEVNVIVVNPFLYVNGEYVVKEIRDLFSDTKWSYYTIT